MLTQATNPKRRLPSASRHAAARALAVCAAFGLACPLEVRAQPAEQNPGPTPAVVAQLVESPNPTAASDTPTSAPPPGEVEQNLPPDATFLERINAEIGKIRTENFPLFLSVYSALAGAALGVVISFLGYRMSDPRSSYAQLRWRGSWLAAACGGAMGVLNAVLKVPHNFEDKLAMLLTSIGYGAVSGGLCALVTFIIQRFMSGRLAKKEGRVLSQRIGRR